VKEDQNIMHHADRRRQKHIKIEKVNAALRLVLFSHNVYRTIISLI